ncbi:hypothetical protein EW026_g4815 [Hermanssonia centrifuga]|uniref:ubiquitinyl hydrolase 1 n=1 Tax=Hermanssonia centrifuga TaxID=98765 RepID=A0A4S4KG05_9APHY|nr:hypothetical protein EW026_g4815 [Hermanssonia centrifuga]
MDPVMRGLAMTNCQFIRQAHNSLARPADLRGSSHAVATSTLEYAKSQKKTRRNSDSSPPKKRRKQNFGRVKKPQLASAEEDVENYHFIAYVPIDGKVWELDGLRLSGPLEVGEITSDSEDGSGRTDWMSVVRPALRRRMQSLQSNESDHVRYNLLAVVEDRYEKASDALEMLKRKRNRLESRLNEELPEVWTSQVDPSLLASRVEAFATSSQGSSSLGPTYDPEFGSQKLEMEMDILDMPARKLGEAWETCVRNAMTAKVAVEDELSNSIRTQTEQLSRTFDYEPLFQTFIICLHNEGCLGTVLPGK